MSKIYRIYIVYMFAVCNKCFTLLLADATLRFGMYPADKVAIFQHLVTPRFPQGDHTINKLRANAGSLCSEV